MGALDHAAAGRYRRGTRESYVWCGLRDAITENEICALFDSQLSGPDTQVSQSGSDETVGVLIFLPDKDCGVHSRWPRGDLLACALFLKRRTNEEGFAFRRKNRC